MVVVVVGHPQRSGGSAVVVVVVLLVPPLVVVVVGSPVVVVVGEHASETSDQAPPTHDHWHDPVQFVDPGTAGVVAACVVQDS